MKKKIIISAIVILIIIFIVFALITSNNKQGNIKNVEIVIGNSEIYSKEEIKDAIDIVLVKFKKFPATLNKIYYDEEKSQQESNKWAKQYNADEAIVLYSDFKTYSGEQALNNGFNPNAEYLGWTWVIVRSNHDEWQLKTWGY